MAAEPHPNARQKEALPGVMAGTMPWLVSICFHVGLILAALFVGMLVVENKVNSEVIVSSLGLSDEPLGNISPGDLSDAAPGAQRQPNQQADSRRYSKRESAISGTDAGGTDKKIDLIGVGGAGALGGGPLAAFGPSASGGGRAGPRTGFFGTGGNAHHVVYVIDRSGSMAVEFGAVKDELINSISRLRPTQSFHIVFFSDADPLELPAGKLVAATPDAKAEAAAFLGKIVPEDEARTGKTSGITLALQRAFQVLREADRSRQGRIIYLLTDGDFPDNKEVQDLIGAADKDKSIQIDTFLYGMQPPEAVKTMKSISEETGGHYKFVNPEE